MNNTHIYFTDANTCSGYKSFLARNFGWCKSIFLLQNIPFRLSDILLRNISDFCISNNLAYHSIMQPGYSDKLCGVYIPCKGTLLYSVPFFEIPVFENAEILSSSLSFHDTERFSHLQTEFDQHRRQMYHHLDNAKKIHDDLEKIYVSNMDFEKADNLAETTVSEIFTTDGNNSAGNNADRFFGTMLPCGSVNYIGNLTHGLNKRIFIKGRPGTGKSTFLKKIRSAALVRGFDTETYYCSFDSKSLDMVIIRELSVCVFDSTSPHEMFPSCDSDSIVDIYEAAVVPGTDEKYSDILNTLYLKYDLEMADAKKHLSHILKIYADVDELFEKSNDDFVETSTARILSALS